MLDKSFDFYNKTNLKSYDLNHTMRYQLGLLDSLDAFTRVHCENVASITCKLCDELHLNDEFTIYCTMCAYLHDLGKLFIPPRILQKKGSLTDEEYKIMKSHTTIGYNMCRKDPNLIMYSAGAKYHHEALNGTGYPDGLTQKDIPLEGQIIRVADEFDAIVSKRQYKSHIGITETLNMLIEECKPTPGSNVGKTNPKIVNALCKVVIADTEYEIYSVKEYLEYLEEQVERLKEIQKCIIKRDKTNKEKKKEYWNEYMKVLFQKGEDDKNIPYVLEEYSLAIEKNKKNVEKLYSEIKEIKKLRA